MQLTRKLIEHISKLYGDAFYILDTEQFQRNYYELLNSFRKIYSNTFVSYSYKTNYTPVLCQLIDKMGGYAEVVSDMEAHIALKSEVKAEKIIYNGPYKNPATLEKLVLDGVHINVDSLSDLGLMKEIALKHPEQIIKSGIRCNFDVKDGVISRFGFDVDGHEFIQALNIFQTIPNLILSGFHLHFATRSLETWPERARGMLRIIEQHYPGIPEYISLGGGIFGKMEESLKVQFDSKIPSYEEYAVAACSLIHKKYGNLPCHKQPQLFIEPGSALAGDIMHFAAKVISIKEIRGKKFATVLGSVYNINPTLNKKNPPIKLFHMGKEIENVEDLDFGGFTCIESDYLYRGYFGQLAVGDFVVFGNIGSYSIVLKPPFILPNFPIIDLNNKNELKLVKEQESFEDIFHTYKF